MLHGYVIELRGCRYTVICGATLYTRVYRRQPHYGHVETVFSVGRQWLSGLGGRGFGEMVQQAFEGGIADLQFLGGFASG